jgi:hypothetical protein
MDLFDSLSNFLIIGAAKAGTTTLFDLLKQHPQVYLPFNKEPMFFSHDDNYQRGPEWLFRTYYQRAAGFPARGEATPHYLYWSEKVAPRIRQVFGQKAIKFIVIFRDPVARAYSWYWNMIKEGREELPFKAALEQEPRRLQEHQDKLQQAGAMTYGYAHGSCYASALRPFLDLFPRQDFLFLLQEDLDNNFPTTVQVLLEFLDLDSGIQLRPVSSNQATLPRSSRVQGWLRNQSGFQDFLMGFFPLRLRYAIKTKLLQANARLVQYPRLDPALEAELRLRFAPEVRRLQEMIDRDLSAWLPR